MARSDIVAGNEIIAEELLEALEELDTLIAALEARLPIRARQTAQVDRTNNTFVDLTGQSAPLGANKVYRVRGRQLVTGANTTHDVKFQFSLPALATIDWSMYAGNTAIAANPMSIDTGTTSSSHARGTVAGTLTYLFEGFITTGANAGTAQLQGAQNTTDPGTCSFLVGSMFSLEEWV